MSFIDFSNILFSSLIGASYLIVLLRIATSIFNLWTSSLISSSFKLCPCYLLLWLYAHFLPKPQSPSKTILLHFFGCLKEHVFMDWKCNPSVHSSLTWTLSQLSFSLQSPNSWNWHELSVFFPWELEQLCGLSLVDSLLTPEVHQGYALCSSIVLSFTFLSEHSN